MAHAGGGNGLGLHHGRDIHHRYLAGAGAYLFIAVPAFLLFLLTVIGMTVLPPNQAGVFLLFGEYKGTARDSGFWWVNPFYTKRKLSLRLHNLNGEKLKVNDSAGNPIEIAAVVVWRVEDTFAACFEVEDYLDYVKVQSESALRHLASRYPYDSWGRTTRAGSPCAATLM